MRDPIVIGLPLLGIFCWCVVKEVDNAQREESSTAESSSDMPELVALPLSSDESSSDNQGNS